MNADGIVLHSHRMSTTHLNSFGRRRGRRLRANRTALMDTVLPRLLIVLPEHGEPLGPLFDSNAPLWFEIGFGGGEHLIGQAAQHPQVNFIGCEPYVNGMTRLLTEIEKAGLTNIRLYDGDARLVLERLPDASLERLFLLFPDPWPKTRHHKRRIVSQEGLVLFHRKLVPGGTLRIATDHEGYGVWMLEHLLAFQGLAWTAHTQRRLENPARRLGADALSAKSGGAGQEGAVSGVG